jgi:hypothetical protein
MPETRSSTAQRVRAAQIGAALFIAQQVVGKATRDALFLSAHSLGDLATIITLSAVVGLAVGASAAHALHVRPARLAALICWTSACCFSASSRSSVVHATSWIPFCIFT